MNLESDALAKEGVSRYELLVGIPAQACTCVQVLARTRTHTRYVYVYNIWEHLASIVLLPHISRLFLLTKSQYFFKTLMMLHEDPLFPKKYRACLAPGWNYMEYILYNIKIWLKARKKQPMKTETRETKQKYNQLTKIKHQNSKEMFNWKTPSLAISFAAGRSNIQLRRDIFHFHPFGYILQNNWEYIGIAFLQCSNVAFHGTFLGTLSCRNRFFETI